MNPLYVKMLQSIADGDGVKQMAARLRLSEPSAKSHLKRIRREMSAQTTAQAVAKALRKGLIT